MMRRLPPQSHEWIDRSRTVNFEFEGKQYSGFAGDTISSALLAEGQTTLARSFKYHRPRSVLSFANHDASVLMQAGDVPNMRADVTPVEDGMQLTAINTFGGLEQDKARVLGALSRFLPVGFYYKAFHSKRLFPMWERMFRFLTGLGKVDFAAPHLRTPKQYDFCDVLVIGAGPSGLSAALAAAEAGAAVVVVDEQMRAGGSSTYQPGSRMAVSLLEKVQAQPRIRLLTGTCAVGYYADHWVPLVDKDKMTKMRAGTVIVAAGAFEQPAVFRNNDLPGIMLATAAQRLLTHYAVQPMQRAVVLTANADGYRAALDLLEHDIEVAAVVDLRKAHAGGIAESAVHTRGLEVYSGACIYEAIATADKRGVKAVKIARFDDGQAGPEQVEVACDGVLMSVGWAPAANLLYQAPQTL